MRYKVVVIESVVVEERETVVIERRGAALVARIDRPAQMNALWTQVYLDLEVALDRARSDDAVRALVLTGSGDRAFCAGGDKDLDLGALAGLTAEQSLAETHLAQRIVRGLYELPKPVIARVNGVAVGGGLDLALACDLAVAAESARFGSVWIKRGLIPALGGAWFLARRVGEIKAKELMLTGDIIDAAEALRIGLVNQVVGVDELDAAVDALVAKIAEASPLSSRMNKELANAALGQSLPAHLETAAGDCYVLSQTASHHDEVATLRNGGSGR